MKKMTPKEALEAIKIKQISIEGKVDKITNFFEGLSVANSALEKQIPKKPTLEGDGYDDNGELIYDTWICPCCEEHYEVDYEDYGYCPKCGQALDWSDNNAE